MPHVPTTLLLLPRSDVITDKVCFLCLFSTSCTTRMRVKKSSKTCWYVVVLYFYLNWFKSKDAFDMSFPIEGRRLGILFKWICMIISCVLNIAYFYNIPSVTLYNTARDKSSILVLWTNSLETKHNHCTGIIQSNIFS